jgi:Protein of unknown function (DUF1194)
VILPSPNHEPCIFEAVEDRQLPNNQGRIVAAARDEVVAQEGTTNGLPIMPDALWAIDSLDLYFRDCVIGGPRAFVIPVREKDQFAEAIRTKVVREIAEKSRSASRAASPG